MSKPALMSRRDSMDTQIAKRLDDIFARLRDGGCSTQFGPEGVLNTSRREGTRPRARVRVRERSRYMSFRPKLVLWECNATFCAVTCHVTFLHTSHGRTAMCLPFVYKKTNPPLHTLVTTISTENEHCPISCNRFGA